MREFSAANGHNSSCAEDVLEARPIFITGTHGLRSPKLFFCMLVDPWAGGRDKYAARTRCECIFGASGLHTLFILWLLHLISQMKKNKITNRFLPKPAVTWLNLQPLQKETFQESAGDAFCSRSRMCFCVYLALERPLALLCCEAPGGCVGPMRVHRDKQSGYLCASITCMRTRWVQCSSWNQTRWSCSRFRFRTRDSSKRAPRRFATRPMGHPAAHMRLATQHSSGSIKLRNFIS